jgi:hypothetical protein
MSDACTEFIEGMTYFGCGRPFGRLTCKPRMLACTAVNAPATPIYSTELVSVKLTPSITLRWGWNGEEIGKLV